jgi:hypothetical protein
MSFRRSLLALAVATLAWPPSSSANDGVDVRTITGLPHLPGPGGPAGAWRNIAVRASSRAVDLEVGIPMCVSTSASAAILPRPDLASGACAAEGRALDPWQSAMWYALKWRTPHLAPSGPVVDFSLRRSRASTVSAANAGGYDADVTVTQALGPLDLYGGATSRFARFGGASKENGIYAGTAVRVQHFATVEFLGEITRQSSENALDRAWTLRVVRGAPDALRLSAFLTYAQDDPREPWRAGISVEHRF